MLSKVENDLLTQTNSGTGAGEYFRRFWLPALLASEVPTPDCPPVRIRLLGEDLVAFRDTQGRVGLMEEFCPHRRSSLFWGRNEECGLRCVYHGWKFDVTGACVDMPNEPPEYGFENKIRIAAYPTREYGGLIWAYLGPPDKTPQLPKLEFARVPDSHRYVSKRLQETNYLQAVEGLLDKAPRFTVKKTDYGLVIAVRRNAEEDTYYWRMTQFLLPSYTIIPYQKGNSIHGHCWVPRDDETCWVWTFTWNPDGPLSQEDRDAIANETFVHANVEPVTHSHATPPTTGNPSLTAG